MLTTVFFARMCSTADKLYIFFFLQESDRTCPCQAGFLETDGDTDCIKKVYPRCADNEYRDQEGECFNLAEYEQHCTGNVSVKCARNLIMRVNFRMGVN